jgi:hypothetical protein
VANVAKTANSYQWLLLSHTPVRPSHPDATRGAGCGGSTGA